MRQSEIFYCTKEGAKRHYNNHGNAIENPDVGWSEICKFSHDVRRQSLKCLKIARTILSRNLSETIEMLSFEVAL